MAKIEKKEDNYVTVDNAFIRNANLSFKAKGLFTYMFSMENNWNFTIKSISKQQCDGEASIKSALVELKEHGFVVYTKHTDGTGTYLLDQNPEVENPHVGNPKMGKSPPIKNTNSLRILIDNNIVSKEANKYNYKNYLDLSLHELFDEYLKLRLTIKCKNTDIAIKLLIGKLNGFNTEDQREAIITSITASYKSLFPKTTKQNNNLSFQHQRLKQGAEDFFSEEMEANNNQQSLIEGN